MNADETIGTMCLKDEQVLSRVLVQFGCLERARCVCVWTARRSLLSEMGVDPCITAVPTRCYSSAQWSNFQVNGWSSSYHAVIQSLRINDMNDIYLQLDFFTCSYIEYQYNWKMDNNMHFHEAHIQDKVISLL